MKTRILLLVIGVLCIAAAFVLMGRSRDSHEVATADVSHAESNHGHAAPSRVPRFQMAEEVKALAPTLAPASFIGKTRQAYQVAREIPETLAQLPCYCYCDQSVGHKSLHSCFTDNHASMCAVCVDEALLAYKLRKERNMTPEQVRQVIVEQYSVN